MSYKLSKHLLNKNKNYSQGKLTRLIISELPYYKIITGGVIFWQTDATIQENQLSVYDLM